MKLKEYLSELVCPKCHNGLIQKRSFIKCQICNSTYPVKNNIPIFFGEVVDGEGTEREFNYWNQKQNDVDNLYENMPDTTFRQLIKMFDIQSNSKGLELGCGDGPFSRRLNSTDNFGLDISLPLLNITNNMKAIQGNALELPFSDEHFDWIIYAFALHHMPNPSMALKEAFRVLKKNGRILIVDPNYYHPIRFITRKPDTFWRKHVFRYLSPDERWVPVHLIKRVFHKNNILLTKVCYLTPEFSSKTFIGRLQKSLANNFNFFPFQYFIHSYYLVEGKKK